MKLNTQHLTALPSTITTKNIPPSVQLEHLLDLFDDINFHSPNEPGYMPPSCLQSYGISYTPQQLRKYLVQFISHVKNQDSILGTPPFTSPHFSRFFTHIEDAVKFCLHTVDSKYDAFLAKRSGIPPSIEDPAYPAYQNLLENKARIALDLAFAGAQCAGNYMNTAIELYQFFREKEERPLSSLEEIVLSSLANAREEIANAQIHTLVYSLQNSTQKEHSSHVRNEYMEKLGSTLGIPGMDTCVDGSSLICLNKKKCLSQFFAVYTVDFVIETIQEKIKTSRKFQEVIVDWTKEQAGSWKKKDYQERAVTLYQKITQLPSDLSTSFLQKHISTWFALVSHLQSKHTLSPFSEENDWPSFVMETLHSTEAKAFYKTSNFSTQIIDLYKTIAVSPIKESCKVATCALVEGKEVFWEKLQEQIALIDRSIKINQILVKENLPKLAEESLLRSLTGKADLHQILTDHLERARKEAFFSSFCPFTKEENPDNLPEDLLPLTGVKTEVLYTLLKQCNVLK